jgi:hypothetical protein
MDYRNRTWTFPRGWLCAALGAFVLSGCVGRGDVELLEANLRQQQDLANGFQRQIADLRGELDAARAEVDQLRLQLAQSGGAAPQEHTEPLARVAGIQFNSMMTGGRDTDGQPGHEVVTAVLSPVDRNGELVKLSGHIEIELLDLARSGEEQRIGLWTFPAEEAHKLWHSGFIASGYQLDLPVATSPKHGQALLHGRLLTSDGRQFDATCPISLASIAGPTSPKGLAPPADARPLGSNSRTIRVDAQASPTQVISDTAKGAVETAGFVRLEDSGDQPIRVEVAPQSRPVPMPPGTDPEGAEVIREEATPMKPRSGPAGAGAKARPKPFPDGVQTSVNWTDATMPLLR